jgi:hypothetical protein
MKDLTYYLNLPIAKTFLETSKNAEEGEEKIMQN